MSPGGDNKFKFATLRVERLELNIVISIRHQSLHYQSVPSVSCSIVIHTVCVVYIMTL